MRFKLSLFLLLQFVTNFCKAQASGTPVVSALADSFYFKSQWIEAIPLYQNIIESGKTTPLAYYRLGFALHQSGNTTAALIAYYNCLSKNPNPNLARVTTVNLAKAYSIINRLDSAAACLNRATILGYANLNDLESSPDFNHFRSTPYYAKIHDQLFNAAYPCVAQAQARWFDFWVGEWTAYVTGTQNQAGESKIEKIAGECAILENWKSVSNGYNGKSINFYNAKTTTWEQHWVGSDGVFQKFDHGEYKDGAMRFTFIRINQNGTESKGKLTFFNQSPDQVRQLAESSDDDGKTWNSDYDFTYIRNKDKIQH